MTSTQSPSGFRAPGRRGMQLNLRKQCALAQARQRTMLGLAEQGRFRAGQDQREDAARSGRAAGHGGRQNPARPDNRDRGGSPSRARPVATASRNRAAIPRRRLRHACMLCPQRLRNPADGRATAPGSCRGAKLLAISRVDVAVPELGRKAEAAGEVEDDAGIRPRLPGRRHEACRNWTRDWASALISKPTLRRLALEADAAGSTNRQERPWAS